MIFRATRCSIVLHFPGDNLISGIADAQDFCRVSYITGDRVVISQSQQEVVLQIWPGFKETLY